MAKVLGIDLGTTNSCMAVMEGGEPLVLENSEGKRTTPSVVAFAKNGERLVGEAAKRQAVTNPGTPSTRSNDSLDVSSTRFKKSSSECHTRSFALPTAMPTLRSKSRASPRRSAPRDQRNDLGQAEVRCRSSLGRDHHPSRDHGAGLFQRHSASGHQRCRQDCRLGSPPDYQRTHRSFVGLRSRQKKDEKIAVYDLGGGTFDISVLEIGDGVFEVKATNGDTHLGGDDWDNAIIDWILAEFQKTKELISASRPMRSNALRKRPKSPRSHCPRPSNTRSTCPSSRPMLPVRSTSP